MVEQLQFFIYPPQWNSHILRLGKTIGEQVWGWKFESWQVNPGPPKVHKPVRPPSGDTNRDTSLE